MTAGCVWNGMVSCVRSLLYECEEFRGLIICAQRMGAMAGNVGIYAGNYRTWSTES